MKTLKLALWFLVIWLLMYSTGCEKDAETLTMSREHEPIVAPHSMGYLIVTPQEVDPQEVNINIKRRIDVIATDTWSDDYQPYKVILTHENGTSECIYGCFTEKAEYD